MKKIVLIISIIFIITACSLNNNPNSKTEELLGKYQRLDNSIIISPSVLANDNNLSISLEKEYNNLIKKQYKNMTYEIKDTIEDGDKAIVKVEIEVINYKKTINNMTGKVGDKYHKKLIKKLNNTNNKTTYTIEINLTKDNNGKWSINPLTNEIENKLLGIY